VRILLTGNRGRVGSDIEPLLRAAGHEVSGFDIVDGLDILDSAAVARGVEGCDAVVHLALVADRDDAGREVAANVQGTWNLLQAASDAGVGRFVYLSSVNALGGFMGAGTPAYLPYDDAHPARPAIPYGLGKLLCEEVCA
jgi:nucleoside-diphosphate-sugar epimerase